MNKLIEALAMLGSDEKIWKIYRTFRGEEDLQLVLEPAAWFRIGVAAANRGRWDDAQRFWQQALEGEPELEPAEFYLEVASLVRGGKAPEGAVPEPTSLPRHGT